MQLYKVHDTMIFTIYKVTTILPGVGRVATAPNEESVANHASVPMTLYPR